MIEHARRIMEHADEIEHAYNRLAATFTFSDAGESELNDYSASELAQILCDAYMAMSVLLDSA